MQWSNPLFFYLNWDLQRCNLKNLFSWIKTVHPSFTLGSWVSLFRYGVCSFLACNSLRKNCITDFNLDIEENWLGFRFSNVANCRSLEIFRRTTFLNTPIQVVEFPTELYAVEISPITLLRSDSSREALLAILKNWKTHMKYFRWSPFSG